MHRLDAGQAGCCQLEMVWLELTTLCNLECLHCYAGAGPSAPMEGRMSVDGWRAVIDEAASLGASTVQFIGGEPTLHPHFRTLLGHAGKAGMRLIEVFTNATRLTDEIVGCLKDNGARVAASFYAGEPAVHDAITKRAGSWERTVAGIERALAAQLPVRIGVIETPESCPHVEGAIAFLKRLGVRDIGVDAERGIGRGRRPAMIGDRTPTPAHEDLTQLCGQCGRNRLCVTAAGTVYPCVFARKTPLGDAADGLRAALQSSALAGFRTAMARELRTRRPMLRGADKFCNPGPRCLPNEDQPDVDPCEPWLKQSEKSRHAGADLH